MSCKALIHRPPEQIFDRTFILTARFEEQGRHHNDSGDVPDSKIWVVSAGKPVKKETGLPWSVWVDTEYYKGEGRYYLPILDLLMEYHDKKITSWFLGGRAMTDEAISIPLCVGNLRPQKLYRVVHDGHPFGGTCARGYGKVKTNPIDFQIHLQKHLHWGYRGLSPFMSATSDLDRARFVGAIYQEIGFTGIQVLVIHTTRPEWKNTKLFHVQTLLKRYDLRILNRKTYFENEYLIQDKIPESGIVRVPFDSMFSQCGYQRQRRYRLAAEAWFKNNRGLKRKRERKAKPPPSPANAIVLQPVSGEGEVERPTTEKTDSSDEDEDEPVKPPEKKRRAITGYSRVHKFHC